MKGLVIFALFLLCFITNGFAQSDEESAVKKTINNLFKGMKDGDSTLTRSAFAPEAIMQTITNKEAKVSIRSESVNNFIKFTGTPHQEKYDERIVFTKILIDGPLASVWTDYKFYLGEKFSQCGVNSFQLVKGDKGWQIVYIIDTRRKDNCN
ncbi:nuclear transport factor 2 family protein [Pedobacter sp. KBS0701]|uniref:nuclear transport factor 2 family protein n=1 Tax=unclassified Pedobacter TaxID=2628915 RepID=UPI00110D6EC1|nr:nuclear transport factor 2 family protein [Pedobacter sp. KBS0701]QDW27062.1 nuclear transport factor 2 family protein [Pedobacter sp. KBS0701]